MNIYSKKYEHELIETNFSSLLNNYLEVHGRVGQCDRSKNSHAETIER